MAQTDHGGTVSGGGHNGLVAAAERSADVHVCEAMDTGGKFGGCSISSRGRRRPRSYFIHKSRRPFYPKRTGHFCPTPATRGFEVA
jgi:hypothetical protein